MMFKIVLFVSLAAICGADLPHYLKICKRDQRTVNACLKESIELLRPKLTEGIPELHIPAIDPFVVKRVEVNERINNVVVNGVGIGIKATGGSKYELLDLKVNLKSKTVDLKLLIPNLEVVGNYDGFAEFFGTKIKGAGGIDATFHKVLSRVHLKAELFKKNGDTYFKFKDVTSDIKMGDVSLNLKNSAPNGEDLVKLANDYVAKNSKQFLRLALPFLNQAVSKVVKNIANGIAEGVKYDEILPIK